jgi:two-component system C4-dicarboxylate transport response regulator DctD
LNSVTLSLPPLISRRGDLPELFRHFLAVFEKEFDASAKPLDESEWHHLMNHEWPGNLHELRAFARNHVLGLQLLDKGISLPSRTSGTLKDRILALEKLMLEDALRQCGGVVEKAGRRLGLPRKTLYDKLAKHSITPRDFRAGQR